MAKDNPLMQGLKQTGAALSPSSIQREASERAAAHRRIIPARIGKKLVGGHFAEEVSIALKVIAAENRTTVQDLMAEAINGIFAKYQKPQIATLRGQREG